ncbi:3-hydroxyacyl-CoA dehydrogenase NAD-binding domain-containing protein [Pseudomonas sp. CNPSo 3701]|uniref:3-hydroxyacyl-CoA dehydrogenase NAD-binding domain-containing protein n=1 Tax=Pseudomonas sp. CNPSo 3701 TaxID=3027943 RepID=UPI002363C424|nr:3-hydroxyacyl-CoA dehydrogenase NAD-binding domain-containing protein [Pseudomonas sp. CNPSo 3701]MDD1506811.1 3-hydroxyacyl-CoA dehydrogenase NAD-binding domain-containing protein [Pseudomonas sp. CNPSo 3701]
MRFVICDRILGCLKAEPLWRAGPANRRWSVAERKSLVAVIGCGLIGESWAALFLAHGFDVQAWDPSDAVLRGFVGRLVRPLAQLESLGLDPAQRGQLRLASGLGDALQGATLVQENAPENIALKQALYADMEALLPAQAIIASSTSALTWSELAPGMREPRRLITAHPFNPPHLVPLVELYGIDAIVLDKAEALYRSVGRHPVRLKKDAVGHIANRLASALWREAVHIVAEGIADVAEVDAALVHGPGLRWSVTGAHMTYHLGGGQDGIAHYLRHLGPSQERRWASLGAPRLDEAVCRALVEGIEREAEGRSIAELEARRDTGLINALRAREVGHEPE